MQKIIISLKSREAHIADLKKKNPFIFLTHTVLQTHEHIPGGPVVQRLSTGDCPSHSIIKKILNINISHIQYQTLLISKCTYSTITNTISRSMKSQMTNIYQ